MVRRLTKLILIVGCIILIPYGWSTFWINHSPGMLILREEKDKTVPEIFWNDLNKVEQWIVGVPTLLLSLVLSVGLFVLLAHMYKWVRFGRWGWPSRW